MFTDSGEETILTGTTSFTGSVSAPGSALNGSTRMRVRLTYTTGMAPCGNSSFGETEDYTLIVSGGLDYGYSWNNAGTLNNALIANPISSATTTTPYTATVTLGLCSAQGNVTLTVQPQPNAGGDGSHSACSIDSFFDVFLDLTGTPDGGGTWRDPSFAAHSNIFTPGTDTPGNYYYIVTPTSPCTLNDTAIVVVNITTATTWYIDTDADGYGDPAIDSVCCCTPAGYVTDNTDDCPSVFGKNGDSCNDANPFTTGDILVACVCVGTPVPCDNWTLTINTDGSGTQTTWQVKDNTSPFILDSGGPYPSNAMINETICVPQGACFDLIFNDSGNNGINPGGWVLTHNLGKRVIDNYNNGSAFTTTCQPDLPFCNPVGADALIVSSCDKMDWLATQYIVASPNAAVSAQWGIGNQADDGYQFWFFKPTGGYSRRILHSHAVSMGYGPASATRACHMPLSFTPNPLPFNTLLNVRVRSLVNGVYSDFGAACRMLLLTAPPACPTTQLDNNPLHVGTTYSCGVTGKVVGASGSNGKIWANPVGAATHYKFKLEVASEGHIRNIVSTNYVLTLGPWSVNPLLCGTFTYDVNVAVSVDGGFTYCPFGPICTVGITNGAPNPCTAPFTGGNQHVDMTTQGEMTMWPNPNREQILYLGLSEVEAGVTDVTVAIYDLFGKQVMHQVINADAAFTTVLDLGNNMASGLYTVNLTAGSKSYSQRLVIQ